MPKVLREGTSYSQREVIETLVDFSHFKDRVEKKFRDLAQELAGKANEHELWVHLYLISSDYAEEALIRQKKASQQPDQAAQKIG
ncbi:MAG: hypothetical protein QMC81_00045 [Thermoanaerobacterales bacterium]|nr:hypothetical protein [Bacillota bacterium]MDI6905866.1 hypothetical protein [Thermoanaerobacterales bacterium]